MTTQDAEPQRAAPYATGGGGTVLEHRYGAVLLCSLLTGDPISELGDDAAPISVRFQASAFSPVDDLVVIGRTPDDEERRVSIGVRRAPALVASEEASAELLSSYLQVVTEHWDKVQKGRWRLALAVVSPNPAVQQVRELAEIARVTTDKMMFRAEVDRPRRTNSGVRGRLPHLTELVSTAATGSGMNLDEDGVREVTWRLLYSLRVRELRLEGDETDRTFAVTQLRTLVPDRSVAAADSLFSRLAELANNYAPAGAVVTESLLRQHLSGISLDRSPSYSKAWRILDGLSERLRDGTGYRLTDHHVDLELAREDARQSLAGAIEAAVNDSRALVVHGEPDVGKSALTLRTAEELATAGAAAMTLSLRDLPDTGLELEALLGGRLKDVLAGTALGSFRLLVVDGAESVLAGRGPLLTDVATAALRAGFCVVAVTRSDGARAVARVLSKAMGSAGMTGKVEEYEVQRLTSPETNQLTTIFPSLARLEEEPRAAWLLGRPGLVDLLLRAGAAADLPGGPLSEADVFAVIWHHLVRNEEVTHPGGPSPDARDRALVSIARRLLLPDSPGERPDATALPSLRSDGLLLVPGPTIAWNPADQFASDLVRDLSLARLLITEGFGVLGIARAPRWALRAVHLACQAVLAASHNTEEAWARLQSTFADLAAQDGQRWAEVPAEAMLTLGSSQEALARVWPKLLVDKAAGLRTLLRLALQRFAEHGIGDSAVLGPVVALTFCGDGDLGEDDRYHRRSTGEQVSELVLAWLRGLVMTHAGPLALRRQVRDRLLAGDLVAYDEFAVEALAMLGPDLDERAEAFLRRLADDGGAHLAPAVESAISVLAMSEYQPQLLITLTEAFYIERYDDDEFGWSYGGFDDGIRHHEKMGGISAPMAAWYYGPFFRLLITHPVEALTLINRMLDHAAAVRVGRREPWETGPQSDELPTGLDLELPGVGVRRCVGDLHVWSWYRGSSVGPYPCMSALLAVERFADQLVDTLQLPLANVSQLLVRDCHNLAMPGLVVGLLVRHFDRVGDLLDPWLARPELWNLEFSRSLGEGHLHVQGADPPELVGRDRRRHNLRDVGAEMTMRAVLAGDQHRLDALADVADELVRRAHELVGDDDESNDALTVEGWASVLRPENYQAHQVDDGRLMIQHEPPEEIASGLAPSLASLARGNEAVRMQATYARSEDRVAPVDTLIADLALARELADDPPPSGVLHPEDPIAAVAAAAIVAHAQGRVRVPDEDLHWAAEVLVEAATHPRVDEMSHALTVYHWAADRSAAAGLPALLLPPFDHLSLDRLRIAEALRSCATSVFDEVRLAFAHGVIPIWETPCETRTDAGSCRHKTAWTAVEEGLGDCRLGDWDRSAQRRLPDHLEGPYDETLPTVETERLLVNRLTAPLIATVPVARGESCVTDAARRLLPTLFDAHRRGLDHWARKGYDRLDRHHKSVAEVLIRLAVAGDGEQLTEYVRIFSSNAPALDELLRDLALRFTYDDDLRPALQAVWRQVMTTALDALEAGADLRADHSRYGRALAQLLPTPQLNTGDTDPDATLERARQSWVAPDAIADLVTRWLPFARREPNAVDAVVQLALCASPLWQATTGLVWVEDVIDRDYAAVAGRCWFLIRWLQAIRASGELDADGTARWRRIVDGLAAEGDSRAVPLQQAEE
jgi:hypothetical protein